MNSRKLIITRGPQGSGKSTLLRRAGLSSYTISPDQLRLVFSSPVMSLDGRISISGENDQAVWSFLKERVQERMKNGELVVIDATFPSSSSFSDFGKMARKFNYKTVCIDFAHGVSLDKCLERNASAERYQGNAVVNDDVVRKTYDACKAAQAKYFNFDVHFELESDTEESRERLIDQVRSEVFHKLEPVDLNLYREIIHIGDLQGCYSPAFSEDGPLSDDSYSTDKFYIFVGDYIDRGPDNGKALAAVMNWSKRHNVVCLTGNHEEHLMRWVRDEPPVSDEFSNNTLPEIIAHGIKKDEVATFLKNAVPYFAYTFNDERVFVTHAGLSTVPAYPSIIPIKQYHRGVGTYNTEIDDIFAAEQAKQSSPWTQVHGHRNSKAVPISTRDRNGKIRSINLEGGVEHGGDLRVACLSDIGWKEKTYRNHQYRPLKDRMVTVKGKNTPYPEWITDPGSDTEMRPIASDELIAAFHEHDFVKVSTSNKNPNVKSFSFTKDAFFQKKWDSVTVKARGFFWNEKTKEIVARGYEKFYNLNERPETSLDDGFLENIEYPAFLFKKENGYLGLIGYDKESDDLFISSKSTPDGDFAARFRSQFESSVSPEKREKLRRFLRDSRSTLTFEVIDPEFDPHIIQYDSPKLVLLDCIENAEDFRTSSYRTLKKIGEMIDIPTKELSVQIDDPNAFQSFLRDFSNFKKSSKSKIEGYVVVDSRGFPIVKLKSPYYSFWKMMRGMKDFLQKNLEKGNISADGVITRVNRSHNPLLAAKFLAWFITQDPDKVRNRDIISLREQFSCDHRFANFEIDDLADLLENVEAVFKIKKSAEKLANHIAPDPRAADALLKRLYGIRKDLSNLISLEIYDQIKALSSGLSITEELLKEPNDSGSKGPRNI